MNDAFVQNRTNIILGYLWWFLGVAPLLKVRPYPTSLKLISMTSSKNIMNNVSAVAIAFTVIAFGFGIGLGTGLFVSNLEEKLPRTFQR